jgi:AbrB family looped-hinge helix DNA binding protein
MNVIPSVGHRRAIMPVSKLGQRRQVVIPKKIWEDLGLEVGDFVEIERVEGTVVIKPKRLVDREDVLTPEEEEVVRRGEAQIRRGNYVTLEKFEHEMERTARKRRGKTTRKGAS